MKNDSPLSIQSNESTDQCIICLSEVNKYSINFPCIFSSCTCKYTMNLNCIKQYSINYCPICKAEIKYSKSIDSLKICDFQTNTDNDLPTNISNQDKIRDLKIVIPATNTINVINTNRYRHVENDNNTCRNCNKICLICIPFFVIGFFISAYYLSSI